MHGKAVCGSARLTGLTGLTGLWPGWVRRGILGRPPGEIRGRGPGEIPGREPGGLLGRVPGRGVGHGGQVSQGRGREVGQLGRGGVRSWRDRGRQLASAGAGRRGRRRSAGRRAVKRRALKRRALKRRAVRPRCGKRRCIKRRCIKRRCIKRRCIKPRCIKPRCIKPRCIKPRVAVLVTSGRSAGGLAWVVGAFLDDVNNLLAGGHQLEDAAVYLPVAELLGLVGVMTQISDVQPVAEIIEHDAALTAELPGWLGLPQRLDLVDAQLLAPVPGRGLEAEFFRRRAGSKQHDIRFGRADARFVGNAAVGGHQPVAHNSVPPCRAQPDLSVEPGDEHGRTGRDAVDLGTHRYWYRI